MIKFLRKYQKFFFILITIVIVVTFSFFGTQSAMRSEKRPKNKIITKLYDGSNLTLFDIERMSLFLRSDVPFSLQGNFLINLFNDNVFYNDFVQTKIAHLLVDKHFSLLQEDFEKKLEKVKKTRFYQHPLNANVSAINIWKKYKMEIFNLIEKVSKKEKVDKEFIFDLFELYSQQLSFPPELMRRILYFQQTQMANVNPDPEIMNFNFSIFGFSNLEEWFGKNYIDLLSEYIYNMASYAKKIGYQVTYQEAFLNLLTNLEKNYAKTKEVLHFYPKGEKERFSYQLKMLGLSEKEAVQIWQNILIVKKYFTDVAKSTFSDIDSFEEISSFVHQKAKVKKFTAPNYLQLEKFSDLLELQMYLLAVYGKNIDESALLKKETFASTDSLTLLSINDIEKKYPQLVQADYKVKMAHIDLQEVSLNIKEVDLWDWQIANDNWKILASRFSSYIPSNTTPNKRFEILEKVPFNIREQIDVFFSHGNDQEKY